MKSKSKSKPAPRPKSQSPVTPIPLVPNTVKPQPTMVTAMQYHQAGMLEEAESLYRQVLQQQPTHPDALHLLGVVVAQLGRNQEAINYITKAITFKPTVASFHSNLGNVLQSLGRFEEAITSHQKALSLAGPNDQSVYNSYNSLGICWFHQNRLTEAVNSFQFSLRVNPKHPETYNNLANVQVTQGKFEEAIANYRKAIELNPAFAGAYAGLGNALQLNDQLEEAVVACQQALQLNPQLVTAYVNLAETLLKQQKYTEVRANLQKALQLNANDSRVYFGFGQLFDDLDNLEEAITHYRKALQLKPDYAGAYNNLGVTLQKQGKLAEAVTYFQKAVALNPYYVEAQNNLGVALEEQDKLEEAIACYQRVIALNPNHWGAHFGLAFVLLKTGNFAQGWTEYLWRPRSHEVAAPLQIPPPPVSLLPPTLAGQRLLLNKEQGLGDELFFLRFAPLLKARGAWLAYRSSKKIASLLSRQGWLDQLVREDEPLPVVDQQLLIGDLPIALGMDRRDKIPPSLPLSVLPARLQAMQEQLTALGHPPYLGVTWWAGTNTERVRKGKEFSMYKEVPLTKLSAALRPVNATVLVLQRHPIQEEIDSLAQGLGRAVYDLSTLNEELEDMLALLALLDEYVGVSNTNMHLLAGLGKTARVLVPHPPEWRWLAQGEESPWFKGFPVYRQTLELDWSGALQRLTTDLVANLGQI